jgi:hypothetical protein
MILQMMRRFGNGMQLTSKALTFFYVFLAQAMNIIGIISIK